MLPNSLGDRKKLAASSVVGRTETVAVRRVERLSNPAFAEWISRCFATSIGPVLPRAKVTHQRAQR